jgi:polyphosphate glucokinase
VGKGRSGHRRRRHQGKNPRYRANRKSILSIRTDANSEAHGIRSEKARRFAHALGLPVKVINDAAMQALGSYRGGKMLFLGLGTGFGTALVVEGVVMPMELGHLPYKKGTYEDYVGRAGLERVGKKKWRHHVADVIERLMAALQPDDTVIGGGNVKKLDVLPTRCRAGDIADAFLGGFRL